MIAIVFEVHIAEGRKPDYLDIAADLKPLLEQVDGFISVERFQSLTNPDKMLSLSFFRDEEAVQRWRNLAEHRVAQARGRAGIFSDYRLKVVQVLRDYGMTDRADAPKDSLAAHGG
ncbi:antibiotic biosynthesis monooxygenase family protein [Thalassovita aquimarina]|uniref:Antibiotic biosynthesis monooxygenase n=1 Tax=Thalassovita aquimarina TaxID=2785917 RepID=A0ABS5HTY9_9RHOB|nr:antibiotic biosynthesis monooxygenase [Thalassovita aquimarina]MBR9652388.1 antibiotic biosynthesis monooxygenase [Thalassovita aquimarina]